MKTSLEDFVKTVKDCIGYDTPGQILLAAKKLTAKNVNEELARLYSANESSMLLWKSTAKRKADVAALYFAKCNFLSWKKFNKNIERNNLGIAGKNRLIEEKQKEPSIINDGQVFNPKQAYAGDLSRIKTFIRKWEVDLYEKFVWKYGPRFKIDDIEAFVSEIRDNKHVNELIALYLSISIRINRTSEAGRSIANRRILNYLMENYSQESTIDIFAIKEYVKNFDSRLWKLFSKQSLDNDANLEIINLPWSYVIFDDGALLLSNPHGAGLPGLKIKVPESKKSFQYIRHAFEKKLPPIKLRDVGGRLKLVDKPLLEDCVSCISSIEIDMKKSKQRPSIAQVNRVVDARLNSSENADIISYIKEKSSDYLDYLCDCQLSNYRIYFSPERRISESSESGSYTEEEAFFFTIRESGSILTIVYENVLESRSSVVFDVKKDHYAHAIKMIGDFYKSDQPNKRELLMHGSIRFEKSTVIGYDRFLHTDFYSWRSRIRNQ